jgi:hypothetical protein
MTETINNANAAASTLFLGQNGEFWDFWLITSVVFAALAAIAIGVTTTGSIVSHKREAAASEGALAKYKLDTAKDIADANDRTSQAQLELQRLKNWRMLDRVKFDSELDGVTPLSKVEILYDPGSDCFMLASLIGALLGELHWPYDLAELKKMERPPEDWMKDFPATLQYRANPTGISFLTKNGIGNMQAKTPAAALVRAVLNGSETSGMAAPDPTLPDGVMRIVVAPKL